MCGRSNQFYDPHKPARLQQALEKKIEHGLRRSIRVEIEEEFSQNQQKEELEQLSQSCVEDGEFRDFENKRPGNMVTSTPTSSQSDKLGDDATSEIESAAADENQEIF